MTQTVTLELPESVYKPAQRSAEATKRRLSEVLVHALRASIPAVEGLSPELTAELATLEKLNDGALWRIMLDQVPAEQQRKLQRLLQKSKRGKLSATERAALAVLQYDADRVMLRKARAAVLLRFRGKRLPTLAEMRKLARGKTK